MKRLSININDATQRQLEELKDVHGSYTEAVRHAIGTQSFLNDQASRGRHIILEDCHGEKRQELVLLNDGEVAS